MVTTGRAIERVVSDSHWNTLFAGRPPKQLQALDPRTEVFRPGYMADVNVIDHDNPAIGKPEVVYDCRRTPTLAGATG